MNKNQKQVKELDMPFATQKEAREHAKLHHFTVKGLVRGEYGYILKYTEKELRQYVILVQDNIVGGKVYYAGKKKYKYTRDKNEAKPFNSEYEARRAVNYEQGWLIEDVEKWV